MLFDTTDTTPAGVPLSDPMDFKKRRAEIFETAKNAFSRKFPFSYGGYKMEVSDLRYEDPETYSLKKQKEAILKNSFLSRRLRGTLHLYNEEDNSLIESKELTLMRVPYLTDRGTTIHNGSEYVTLTQARLLPGIYTRRKETGEIEAHFNARRGTGSAFRIRLEPESQLYKMDIGQASLRLYSLLHDIGVSDEQLAKSWGKDILETNKAGYDARVFEKAYQKLVRFPEDEATREQKTSAIQEALEDTKFTNSVLQRTLPNLFNKKVAATWFAKSAMMMQPQQYAGTNPQLNSQLVGQQVADSPDAYVKFEQQKQEAARKEEERKQKHRMSMELLYGKLPNEGPDQDALEKQMVQSQIALRKARNQAMTKTITGQQKMENQEQIRKIKEETQRHLDSVKLQRKEIDDYKKEVAQRDKEKADEAQREREETQKERLKTEAEQRKADIKERQEKRRADIKINSAKRKTEIQRKAEKLKKELEAKIKKYMPPKKTTATKKADEESPEAKVLDETKTPALSVRTAVEIMLDAKKHSDLREYDKKNSLMRGLIKEKSAEFFIDSDEKGIVGITHSPSGFQMHLPKEVIFDLNLSARNPKEAFYKESKKRHVKVTPNGQMIDVSKLYDMVKDRDIVKIDFDQVKGVGSRSRRNRFGPKRYDNADVTKPGLIDASNYILDGRHRLAKAKDGQATSGLFYVVTPKDISKAYVDGSHGDFKTQTKVKF